MSLNINNIAGKTIHEVVHMNDCKIRKVSARVSSHKYLPNYYITVAKQRWLILYNYGNDILSPQIERRFFVDEYTLAINETTGVIAIATADRESKRVHGKRVIRNRIYLTPLTIGTDDGSPVCVPLGYRLHLKELESAKRPYHLGFEDFALMGFIDHEYSYNDLEKCMTISLQFDDCVLRYGCGSWTVETEIK